MELFHADWFGQYKYDSNIDNYSIRFEISNKIAQLFDSIRNKKTLFAQH